MFWKDNQKITLASMEEEDLPRSKLENNINLQTKHSYLKEVVEAGNILVVVEKGKLAE